MPTPKFAPGDLVEWGSSVKNLTEMHGQGPFRVHEVFLRAGTFWVTLEFEGQLLRGSHSPYEFDEGLLKTAINSSLVRS